MEIDENYEFKWLYYSPSNIPKLKYYKTIKNIIFLNFNFMYERSILNDIVLRKYWIVYWNIWIYLKKNVV